MNIAGSSHQNLKAITQKAGVTLGEHDKGALHKKEKITLLKTSKGEVKFEKLPPFKRVKHAIQQAIYSITGGRRGKNKAVKYSEARQNAVASFLETQFLNTADARGKPLGDRFGQLSVNTASIAEVMKDMSDVMKKINQGKNLTEVDLQAIMLNVADKKDTEGLEVIKGKMLAEISNFTGSGISKKEINDAMDKYLNSPEGKAKTEELKFLNADADADEFTGMNSDFNKKCTDIAHQLVADKVIEKNSVFIQDNIAKVADSKINSLDAKISENNNTIALLKQILVDINETQGFENDANLEYFSGELNKVPYNIVGESYSEIIQAYVKKRDKEDTTPPDLSKIQQEVQAKIDNINQKNVQLEAQVDQLQEIKNANLELSSQVKTAYSKLNPKQKGRIKDLIGTEKPLEAQQENALTPLMEKLIEQLIS